MLQAKRSRVQRNVMARFESFGEVDADLAALNPGTQPVLLLIKQVDQVGALNGRLPPATGRRDLRRIVGMTCSAPARMKIATPLPYS
jgi:hypothetical protein